MYKLITLTAIIIGASTALGQSVFQNKVQCSSAVTDTGETILERNSAASHEWHLKGISSMLVLQLKYDLVGGDFQVEVYARDYLGSQNMTVRLHDKKLNRTTTLDADNKVQFYHTFEAAPGIQNLIETNCYIEPK